VWAPEEVVVSNAVIVDAVRTPMGRGKAGGALAQVHPVDLLAQTLTALVARTGIDRIEDGFDPAESLALSVS
jgi:acetyl-CoA acetyltransferase